MQSSDDVEAVEILSRDFAQNRSLPAFLNIRHHVFHAAGLYVLNFLKRAACRLSGASSTFWGILKRGSLSRQKPRMRVRNWSSVSVVESRTRALAICPEIRCGSATTTTSTT